MKEFFDGKIDQLKELYYEDYLTVDEVVFFLNKINEKAKDYGLSYSLADFIVRQEDYE